MTTAAEEIVEKIVLENVLFDQICQPNIGHHRQRFICFLFAINANLPSLIFGFHLFYLFGEFAQHLLLIFFHQLFLHPFLLHYFLTFGFELFCFFILDLFQVFCQLLFFLLDHCNLFNKYFGEENSQAWIQESSEKISVFVFAVDKVKSEDLTSKGVEKPLNNWISLICKQGDELHTFFNCQRYQLRTVNLNFSISKARILLLTCQIGHLCLRQGSAVYFEQALIYQKLKRLNFMFEFEPPLIYNDIFCNKFLK